MKILAIISLLLFCVAALAEELPLTLAGHTNLGDPCELRVESISFYEGWENNWEGLRLKVSTNLQAPGATSLEAHRSPTPAVLYGRSAEGHEQISLHFSEEILDPAAIRYFLFQRPGTSGPFQARCVIDN